MKLLNSTVHCSRLKFTLESSGKDVKTTLETSVNFQFYDVTRRASVSPLLIVLGKLEQALADRKALLELRADKDRLTGKTTLETSGKDVKLHSRRVGKL
jgi:hypothetical protein